MSRGYAIKLILAIAFAVVSCAIAVVSYVNSTSTEESWSPAGAVPDRILAEDYLDGQSITAEGFLRDAWRRWRREHASPQEIQIRLERAEALQPGITEELLKIARTEGPDRAGTVHFLAWLEHRHAVDIAISALDSQSEEVRRVACGGVRSLSDSGIDTTAATERLLKLRRGDPSIDVRVSASLALRNPTHAEAIDAFKKGLDSDNAAIRERSEAELERQGLLELPLSDRVYLEITQARYEGLKSDGRGRISRVARMGGMIYFEADVMEHHFGETKFWYKVKEPLPEMSND